MPTMTPINSSLISSVGYDPDTEELHVKFRSGKTYIYDEVPQDLYDRLMRSNSKGAFFISQIKNTFNFRKLAHA